MPQIARKLTKVKLMPLMQMKSLITLTTTCKRASFMSWDLSFKDLQFSSMFFVVAWNYFSLVHRLHRHRYFKSEIDSYSAK